MSSSPNISFVLHDDARLYRQRSGLTRELQTLCLIKPSLLDARPKPAVDREIVHV